MGMTLEETGITPTANQHSLVTWMLFKVQVEIQLVSTIVIIIDTTI